MVGIDTQGIIEKILARLGVPASDIATEVDAIITLLGTPTWIQSTLTTSDAHEPVDINLAGLLGANGDVSQFYLIPIAGVCKYVAREINAHVLATGHMVMRVDFPAAPGIVPYVLVPHQDMEAIIVAILGTIQAKTDLILPGIKIATKTLATISATVTDNNLFTVTGLVDILSITLFVTTTMGTARTLRLGIYDATLTTEQFMCAASSSIAFALGTLLGITGIITDAMVGTTAVGQIPSQAQALTERPTTTATIRLTAAGASTGVIVAEILWIPKNAAGSVVAA